jgi:hypothetical protein
MKQILKEKTNESRMNGDKKQNQPPIKAIVVKALINIIELYSPRKNRAKPILEYSTL